MEDGMLWGFMEHGRFITLRKLTLIRAGYGPPPFTLKTPEGDEYQIVGMPDGSKP